VAILIQFGLAINVSIAQKRPAQAVKVAAIQFNPRLGVLKENVDALAIRFDEAAQQGAKIIVAPEMATTGYLYLNRTDIQDVVETIPGPTTRRFARIAKRYDCYLVWGMPERDLKTGLFYNSSVMVGPEGLVARYRKTHLWESEAHWSSWGDLGIPVFETRYGRVAMLICQDANYVETFRLAALEGADIVCFSTNSSGQTIGHLQARAIQNGVFIISANRSNSEIDRFNGKPFTMRGCSAIWSPQGEKLASAGSTDEEIVYAAIDPEDFEARSFRLASRRPETYQAIARHVAPWDYRATAKPRNVQAVAVQYLPEAGKIEANKQEVEQLLANHFETISQQSGSCEPFDARLIVFPELSLTGRATAERLRELAEPIDHSTTQNWATTLAKRYEAFIVCGLPEREGKKLYNASLVIDPEGRRIGHARKVHLNSYDRTWASPGNDWTVIQHESLGRLGLLIGTDSYIPEAGTIMAIQRADLVAVSANWNGEIAITPEINPHAKRNAMVLWDEMSWGQQFYSVVANTSASENQPGGKSGIYSTDPIYGIESTSFAETDGAEVVSGTFQTLNGQDPDHWIDQSHYIGSRRPDALYHPLVIPASTANPSPKIRQPLHAPREPLTPQLVP